MTTTTQTTPTPTVTIQPASAGAPVGKLAEAELQFHGGPLEGLRLVGFTIWASRDGERQHVTFPARPYQVNGERRHYALLRGDARQPLIDLILAAYAEDRQTVTTS